MSTFAVGTDFEKKIFALLEGEIANGRFWAMKDNCRLYRQKAYYSKDRGSEIIFDVAIEIFLPGSDSPSMLVLVECKDHKNTIKPEQVEAFFSKVQQVAAANIKAVVATTSPLQSGALGFAKSKGIGVLRYCDPQTHKWEIYRSPSASAGDASQELSDLAQRALTEEDFTSNHFDMYMQSPLSYTVSLYDFMEQLCAGTNEEAAMLRDIRNPKSKTSIGVPYIEKEQLEERSSLFLKQIEYEAGEVSLDRLCADERSRSGLQVVYKESLLPCDPLGKISFKDLQITIFRSTEYNRGRERFTLAHELAHYFLGHGEYVKSEIFEPEDFALMPIDRLEGKELRRLEFQANYFAASLLMPKANFVGILRGLLTELGIMDRGFGLVYLDEQECNRQSFQLITSFLSTKFGVSKEAASIRLNGLGLLVDARK